MDAQTTAAPEPPGLVGCPIDPQGVSDVHAMLMVGAVAAVGLVVVLAWRRARARRDEVILQGTRRHRPAAPPPPGA